MVCNDHSLKQHPYENCIYCRYEELLKHHKETEELLAKAVENNEKLRIIIEK